MNSLVEHLHNEFDFMRLLNKKESQTNDDEMHFKNIWIERFNLKNNIPILEWLILNLSVSNELHKYVPKGLS